MKWSDNTTLTIVIIGAINWLLVGIFRFDLVAFLFGNLSWLSRIVYTIVGLCTEESVLPHKIWRTHKRGESFYKIPLCHTYSLTGIPFIKAVIFW